MTDGSRKEGDAGDEPIDHLEEVTAHVERHYGPVETVFHELVSDRIHLDVLVVAPRPGRDRWTLVTSGVSDLPMTVPDGAPFPRHAELVLHLETTWAPGDEGFEDERNYWPIRQLKRLGRLPHDTASWLGPNHTCADDPPEPYAPGIPFCAMLVLEASVPAVRRLACADGTEIAFYEVVPLQRDELEAKLAGDSRIAARFAGEERRVVRATSSVRADRRGRRLVLLAVIALAVTFVLDAIAVTAAGLRFPFGRLVLGSVLLVYLYRGSVFARWATVVLVLVGLALGIQAFVRGKAPWWLLVAMPLWLTAVNLLIWPPSVRRWFGRAG